MCPCDSILTHLSPSSGSHTAQKCNALRQNYLKLRVRMVDPLVRRSYRYITQFDANYVQGCVEQTDVEQSPWFAAYMEVLNYLVYLCCSQRRECGVLFPKIIRRRFLQFHWTLVWKTIYFKLNDWFMHWIPALSYVLSKNIEFVCEID